jgi:hypothetical protein
MPRQIVGRADTTEKKRRITERIYRAWLAQPYMRLGQLLLSANKDVDGDIFYREDEDLAKDCEQFQPGEENARPKRAR